MKRIIRMLLVCAVILMPQVMSAQKVKTGISTNLLGWANYGTANIESTFFV